MYDAHAGVCALQAAARAVALLASVAASRHSSGDYSRQPLEDAMTVYRYIREAICFKMHSPKPEDVISLMPVVNRLPIPFDTEVREAINWELKLAEMRKMHRERYHQDESQP